MEKASEDHPGGYGVSLLCRALKVARSAYYVWLAARPAAEVRQAAEDDLAGEIRSIFFRLIRLPPRRSFAVTRGAP